VIPAIEQRALHRAAALERYVAIDSELHRREHTALRALEASPPAWVSHTLGPVPAGLAERRAWREAARAAHAYRTEWGVIDQHSALGASPVHDFLVRRARQHARQAIDAAHGWRADHDGPQQPPLSQRLRRTERIQRDL
jgi:hypothetical protein